MGERGDHDTFTRSISKRAGEGALKFVCVCVFVCVYERERERELGVDNKRCV